MMRRLAAVLLGLAAVGCGAGDPAKSRLRPGAEVVVLSDIAGKDSVVAKTDDYSKIFSLPSGTKVRVVGDTEGEEVRAGDPDSAERGVRVNVIEGEHSGDVVKVARRNLRPIP